MLRIARSCCALIVSSVTYTSSPLASCRDKAKSRENSDATMPSENYDLKGTSTTVHVVESEEALYGNDTKHKISTLAKSSFNAHDHQPRTRSAEVTAQGAGPTPP